MPEKIYVIEDDENIRSLLKIALESYSYTVFSFETAEEALGQIAHDLPALCIFDIMLPGMDGITAVRRVRAMPGFAVMPILLLTARDAEMDKVVGLDSGADDYVTKPFGVMELMARVRALLRRNHAGKTAGQAGTVRTLELEINSDTREVRKNGQLLSLTYKEYEILQYLLKRREQVVSRELILEELWGYDFDVETRTLDMHIRSLRHKLGGDGETYIKTVRGVGYRFCAPVSEL